MSNRFLQDLSPYEQQGIGQIVGEIHYGSMAGSGSSDPEYYNQSNNFVSGSSGWKIDGYGNAEFATGSFRGSVIASAIYVPSSSPKFIVNSAGEMSATSAYFSGIIINTLGSSIDGADINADSIQANSISSSAITTDKLAANSITSAKISASSISTQHIVTSSLNSSLISSASISTQHLVANSINSSAMSVGAIDVSALQADSVTSDKINVSQLCAIAANMGCLNAGRIVGGKVETSNAVGAGSDGVVMDISGIRGYNSTLGQVFTLPTDGSAPKFSSGVISATNFYIDTSAVLQTSTTVGDGSANSAGIKINNTGIYGCGANQAASVANFKVLSTGDATFQGSIVASTIIGGDIMTNISGQRVLLDSTGIKTYNSSGGVNGAINNSSYTNGLFELYPNPGMDTIRINDNGDGYDGYGIRFTLDGDSLTGVAITTNIKKTTDDSINGSSFNAITNICNANISYDKYGYALTGADHFMLRQTTGSDADTYSTQGEVLKVCNKPACTDVSGTVNDSTTPLKIFNIKGNATGTVNISGNAIDITNDGTGKDIAGHNNSWYITNTGNISAASISATAVYPAVSSISTNSISTQHLVNASIDATKISMAGVSSSNLGPNSVLAVKISNAVISTQHYGAGSINSTALSSPACLLANYGPLQIDATKISAAGVSSSNLGPNSVIAAKISNAVISTQHYGAGSINSTALSSPSCLLANYGPLQINATKISAAGVSSSNIGPNAIALGTQISTAVISTQHIIANSIDATCISAQGVGQSELAAGAFVQGAYTSSSAVDTTTNTVPVDDTIPQTTEMKQALTISYTPKSTTNILVIEGTCMIANNTNGTAYRCSGITTDANTNMLAFTTNYSSVAGAIMNTPVMYAMAAGTTSAITVRLYYGGTAGTTTLNGSGGSSYFSTAVKTFLKVSEYKA
jgi:trimeric autotransporter adhesin